MIDLNKVQAFNEIFKNLRSLKSALAASSVKEISEMIEKLNLVKAQHEQAEAEKAQKEADRKAAIEQIQDIAKQKNISLDEIFGNDKPLRANAGKKRPPKYRWQLEDGSVKEWSGQGLTPVSFRNLLAQTGKSKEEFLINK